VGYEEYMFKRRRDEIYITSEVNYIITWQQGVISGSGLIYGIRRSPIIREDL